jgi:hypothetical protein
MRQNSFPAGSCNTRVVQSHASARDTNDAPAARISSTRGCAFHEEVEVNSSFGGLRFRNGLKGQERRSVRAPVSSLERHVRPPSRARSARVAEAAFPERGELCRVRAIHRDSDPLRSRHTLSSFGELRLAATVRVASRTSEGFRKGCPRTPGMGDACRSPHSRHSPVRAAIKPAISSICPATTGFEYRSAKGATRIVAGRRASEDGWRRRSAGGVIQPGAVFLAAGGGGVAGVVAGGSQRSGMTPSGSAGGRVDCRCCRVGLGVDGRINGGRRWDCQEVCVSDVI